VKPILLTLWFGSLVVGLVLLLFSCSWLWRHLWVRGHYEFEDRVVLTWMLAASIGAGLVLAFVIGAGWVRP